MEGEVATPVQIQVRCADCNRRLADFVNEIGSGQVLVELKCPRCGQPHLEVIRSQPSAEASTATSTRPTGAIILTLAQSFLTGVCFAIVLLLNPTTAPL